MILGMFDRRATGAEPASYAFPSGNAVAGHENTNVFFDDSEGNNEQDDRMDGAYSEIASMQREISDQLNDFQTYLNEEITPEAFAKPYEEFIGKFEGRLQQMFSQQSASQQNQLNAQVRASRDRRAWVIQEKTDQLERQIEQNYVKNMMKAEQWYTSGIADSIQKAGQLRTQGEEAITRTMSQNYSTTASFIGNMYAQRQANYRAELRRSTALAQIRARQEENEVQREFEKNMWGKKVDQKRKDFDRKWDLMQEETAKKQEFIEGMIGSRNEAAAQESINWMIDEINQLESSQDWLEGNAVDWGNTSLPTGA